MTTSILHGDSLKVLPTLPAASFDSLVTDPPAGIGFMGKEWDGSKGGRDKWIAWLTSILVECRHVLKPGVYGWVWAIPRTAHWTAMACENAGFAVRDVLVHVFGTGFPKSRALLKPASEHWILIKAPGELQELRIDENRIACDDKAKFPAGIVSVTEEVFGGGKGRYDDRPRPTDQAPAGRWPANFALSHGDECGEACADDCPVKMLDGQSGFSQSPGKTGRGEGGKNGRYGLIGAMGTISCPADSGGASRFFYVAKPSSSERSKGLDEGEKNKHPTVKSIKLMRHLARLITPSNGHVLDPFAGSGSTGVACKEEGFDFTGIEQSDDYVAIARKRCGLIEEIDNETL